MNHRSCDTCRSGARRSARVAAMLLVAVPTAGGAQQSDSLPQDTLPPVFIYPDRYIGDASWSPFAVTLIGAAAIRDGRAGVGLDEALRAVPGVYVANRYNFALDQRLAIRGFGARSAFGVRGVQVLVDGIPQTLPDGQGQLTNLELAEVERIAVLRGPASAMFGNASGGVVSVRTRPPIAGTWTGRARVVGGSHGLRKWHGAIEVPMGMGGFNATVSRTTVEGFRDSSSAELRHASVRMSRPLLGGDVTLLAQIDDNPVAQNPGALTRAEADSAPWRADPRNAAVNAGKAVTQAQAGMGFHSKLLGGGELEASVFVVGRDLDNPLAFAVVALDRLAYGVRSSARMPFAPTSAAPVLTIGVDVQWQHDERRNFSPDRTRLTLDQVDRVHSAGPFVHVFARPVAGVGVAAGARLDAVRFAVDDRFLDDGDQSGERTLSAVSWTIGASVDVLPGLESFATVGTSFETPTTTEFINRADGLAGLNPELEPQRAVSYELGVRGSYGAGVHYTLTAFHADVTDELIGFESPVEPGRTVFRNAGSANHRGLEASLRGAWAFGLSLQGAYTYADYRFENFAVNGVAYDGNLLPGIPRHRLYGEVRYEAPAGWWIGWEETYTAALYADDANSQAAVAPAWWVAALRAGWRGAVGVLPVAVFGAVENVLDRRYIGSVVVNARGGRYFEPAPGRTVVVGMEIGR